MSIIQLAVILGIGCAASGLAYYAYFRKAAAIVQRPGIENPVAAQVGSDFAGQRNAQSPLSLAEKYEIIEPAKTDAAKQKPKTPINAKCGHCKEASVLPFRCKFCSQFFCGNHRLPENHECGAL